MLSVRRTGSTMGAEISGADLSQPIGEVGFAEIQKQFLQHQVVVFRNQKLTAPQFLSFSRHFGNAEPHVLDQFHHPDDPDILVLSNVVRGGKPLGLADGGTYWHSDYSYLDVPARATLLYSIEVPKVGGNTMFADQVAAYADLSQSMKARIDKLVAIHHYGNRDDMDLQSRTVAFPPDEKQKQVRGIRNIAHPLVRRHPLTGTKVLYAVSGTSLGIEGMPQNEALQLLRELAAHSTQLKYQFSVIYDEGDVVVWDNAAVLHSATLVAPDDARTLWRITVKERERPIA
ncbi:MAG: TauD/TfdA family dioxygenase [Betaproteobacteria bacterium]